MSEKVPTREEAYKLLTQYNQNDSLIKHALAVEGVMRYLPESEEKTKKNGALLAWYMTWIMSSSLKSTAGKVRKF